MNMTLWNPLKDMDELFDRYNQNTKRALSLDTGGLAMADWSPSVDVDETDTEFNIKAEMPGVKKEDVHVTYDNGLLTIKGEKKEEKTEGKKGKNHRRECFYGSFSRSFTLPDGIKLNDIDANYKKGVLTLTLPKSEEGKPESTEIEIK
ncbi:Hsp20/alpha crystallin family protein [uncultured Cocleimonas sp.]|uniref:Hsp20/alpha crystallin family protein n=1 Tax=uncultured Cocleimonas sp. TaxID=1051587 RepID=UPI00260E0B75|nr:Hsp20/alpha crystallin family protein [uncultured Cocleimonas sp.]